MSASLRLHPSSGAMDAFFKTAPPNNAVDPTAPSLAFGSVGAAAHRIAVGLTLRRRLAKV